MQSQVQKTEHSIRLSGDLIFSRVVNLRNQLEHLIAESEGRVLVDFEAVAQVDSSALSLWLCLERHAAPRNVELVALNVPQELHSIARLAGLTEIGLA